MYGRKSMGVERSTFVIDADGVVRAVFARVKVDGHSDAVIVAWIGCLETCPATASELLKKSDRRFRIQDSRMARPAAPGFQCHGILILYLKSAASQTVAVAGRPNSSMSRRAAEMLLELSQRLVFLVADAGERQIELLADLGHGPAAHPQLDDPVLALAEHGPAGRFQDLAQLDPVAVALVDVGSRCGAVERLEPLGALTRLRTMSMARTNSRRSGVSSASTCVRSSWPSRAFVNSRQHTSCVQSSQSRGTSRAFRQQTVQYRWISRTRSVSEAWAVNAASPITKATAVGPTLCTDRRRFTADGRARGRTLDFRRGIILRHGYQISLHAPSRYQTVSSLSTDRDRIKSR